MLHTRPVLHYRRLPPSSTYQRQIYQTAIREVPPPRMPRLEYLIWHTKKVGHVRQTGGTQWPFTDLYGLRRRL